MISFYYYYYYYNYYFFYFYFSLFEYFNLLKFSYLKFNKSIIILYIIYNKFIKPNNQMAEKAANDNRKVLSENPYFNPNLI